MSTFLTAEWLYLVTAHYRVKPAVVERLVPIGTEIDDWNGEIFVSLLGFRFVNTRVKGIAIPLHRDFNEINLRFYVRRRVRGEVRRGVVFIKDIVGLPVVAWTARLTFNEPYAVHSTRAHAPPRAGMAPGRLMYEWRSRSGWNHMVMEAGGDSFIAKPESLERFVTDRPWGYTRQRDGGTVEYSVHHADWRLWQPRETAIHCHGPELYGPELGAVVRSRPDLSLIADGSPVAVSDPMRIA